ncbi:extracellular solute-binding protein [Paenibacillus sp. HB172176]|uniref:extracellular solute-binding protein n=1 Tax=Paenibacillus sp. HB172176 TaxID=2493690 RepID=UPI001F115F29|nr:extracellular solute-binding protein [Paenibacillus sp. HB172176]
MKKNVILFSAACLLAGLVGCSSNNNSQSSEVTPSSTKTADEGQSLDGMDKTITISSISGSWSDPIPDPKGNGVQMMNDKFNINFKPQIVPYDEYANKLPVVMAAGDLPDMVGMESVDANFVKWAKQGAFLPLNDYIENYDALKSIPKYVWDAVSIDGKIYGIPEFFPSKYGKKPVIRQDWLDNLGLEMPTNYEELEKAAIAFTNDDPDKNGQKDTLGLGLAKDIVYGAPMGAAYDNVWYSKNEQGQLIPGNISDGFKQQVTMLHDLYQAGAISKDWALTKSSDARKDFFAGKTGIWFEQPYDITETRFKQLKEASPEAKLAVIPPFQQDDGQQGFIGLPGYYQLYSLNASMKNDPDKIDRILQIINYFMTFIPVDERNPQNPEFDWQNGGVDVGYSVENGVSLDIEGASSEQPKVYLSIPYWAPADEDTQPAEVLQDPFTKSFVQSAVDLMKSTKTYLDPVNRIHSELYYAKSSELNKAVTDHQTRMIVGQESLDDWDKMVEEFMSKGGQDMINEVNSELTQAGIAGEWK